MAFTIVGGVNQRYPTGEGTNRECRPAAKLYRWIAFKLQACPAAGDNQGQIIAVYPQFDSTLFAVRESKSPVPDRLSPVPRRDWPVSATPCRRAAR